jgi:hypothetical protein
MRPTEQFVSSLVNALAWPGTVLVLVCVFRRQLSELLDSDRLRRLRAGPIPRAGPIDFVFDRQLAKVEEIVALDAPGATLQGWAWGSVLADYAPPTVAPGGRI